MKSLMIKFHKPKGTLRFGLLGLVFTLFFSSVNAQEVSELSQYLASSLSSETGIDQEYLFGKKPYVLFSPSQEKFPKAGSVRKIIAEGRGIDKVNSSDERIAGVELIQVKINTPSDKSISVDPSRLEGLENLQVILILSAVPISKAEVEQMFSRFTDLRWTILYQYSEPV